MTESIIIGNTSFKLMKENEIINKAISSDIARNNLFKTEINSQSGAKPYGPKPIDELMQHMFAQRRAVKKKINSRMASIRHGIRICEKSPYVNARNRRKNLK